MLRKAWETLENKWNDNGRKQKRKGRDTRL
jgi:hypothetical protein